ncbi:MAG TPA: hypothetical protein PKM73_01320 [Verrucomicrobiota bacterium]|nr:hypothetical protein [Verrucomicrobiota bacterium]HNU50024.1 hypothetical protein [Verrucomicrobiota bacterium]
MNIAALTRCRRAVSVRTALAVACLGFASCGSGHTGPLSLEGVHVVPHVQSSEMRYRQKTDFSLGARVEVFLRNTSPGTLVIPPTADIRARGRTPEELLTADEWAWHDLPSAWGGEPLRLPPGGLTVWSWNGKRAPWGTNTQAELSVLLPGLSAAVGLPVTINDPTVWLSAVTCLGSTANVQPDSLMFHVVNRRSGPLRLQACRLWLPENNTTWRALLPQPWISNRLDRFPADGVIAPNDRGGARVATGPLPLTYAALEVRFADAAGKPVTLWAHQRIKREVFDISGGWVASKLGSSNTLHAVPYLQTLARMHINAGMHQHVPGYSDTPLFEKYPLKYMNRLQPLDQYDTDHVLPRIHAVEFLGEPQYGGGKPVPPQECWKAFSPYAPTRLPTSVTHSEERVWRFYAGISDYPHYDAYRVTAPSPDAWSRYDRWDGQRIRWGSPLETIGEMSRALRELSRPRPTAYWSQGPHHDWEGYGGRKRGSPTADELRLQAYHGLASRITSLYWFNLSLRSLATFPDLIEPMTRIGREIRMLEDYYLEGDAVGHERLLRDGRLDWDLDVVAGPRGALLFALDLNYKPDPKDRVFQFGPPRAATFRFRVPAYVSPVAEVFRIDADGLTQVGHTVDRGIVEIRDQASRVAVYVVAAIPGEWARIEARRQALVAAEDSLGFDPGRNPEDLAVLQEMARKK